LLLCIFYPCPFSLLSFSYFSSVFLLAPWKQWNLIFFRWNNFQHTSVTCVSWDPKFPQTLQGIPVNRRCTCISELLRLACGVFHRQSKRVRTYYINKSPTWCILCSLIYFTAKSLYMFRVTQYPSSGVLKTVTAASGTGHNIGPATSFQRGQVIIFTSLLSLGGLPPFLGFLPKWIVIQAIITNNITPLATVVVVTSLITLYYYLKISCPSFIILNTEPKWNLKLHKNKSTKNISAIILSSISLTKYEEWFCSKINQTA